MCILIIGAQVQAGQALIKAFQQRHILPPYERTKLAITMPAARSQTASMIDKLTGWSRSYDAVQYRDK